VVLLTFRDGREIMQNPKLQVMRKAKYLKQIRGKFPEWNDEQILAHFERIYGSAVNPYPGTKTFQERDIPSWMHEELQ